MGTFFSFLFFKKGAPKKGFWYTFPQSYIYPETRARIQNRVFFFGSLSPSPSEHRQLQTRKRETETQAGNAAREMLRSFARPLRSISATSLLPSDLLIWVEELSLMASFDGFNAARTNPTTTAKIL